MTIMQASIILWLLAVSVAGPFGWFLGQYLIGHGVSILQLNIGVILLNFVIFLTFDESWLMDPREPPIIRAAIPYIGNLIGILRQGSAYYKTLGRGHGLRIFTLRMLHTRLYIVTDPVLASRVQRASKDLSFNDLVPPIIQRVAGFDNATIALMKSDMESGYIQQVQNVVHLRLSQGHYLNQLTLDACEEFRRRLDLFDPYCKQSESSFQNVELLGWIKHLVTVGTATFFYGPSNPVERNPQLVDQFWDFDAGIPSLLLGILPRWTARKAYRGREAVVSALKEYLVSPEYFQAAAITRERSEIGRKLGVSIDAIARSDLTFFFAGIINTSLTSFWMLANIYHRPGLLVSIRAELDSLLRISPNDSTHYTISIKDLTTQSPLLHGVFKEVLRLYSDNFVTRLALTDILLADTFFLKKGSIVQISGGLIHNDERVWGPDVAQFRPERHLNSPREMEPSSLSSPPPPPPTTTTEETDSQGHATHKNVHPAAFRAFGGGATLCPGRHFALNEILTLVAMIVIQFEIEGPSSRHLQVPQKNDRVLPIHVLEPVRAMPVRMWRRHDWTERRLRLET